jgi:phage replication O-like protein O
MSEDSCKVHGYGALRKEQRGGKMPGYKGGDITARPQKENGYTPVANEIMDQIIRLHLSGMQFRILMVVWRYTYGFSRKEHDLSVSFILSALGLDKTQYKQVSRELRKLIDMNIICEVSKPDKNKTRLMEFNKNYDLWTNLRSPLKSPLDKFEVSSKKSIGVEPAENGDFLPLDNLEVTSKKSSKKTNSIYKNKYTTEFENFYAEYPRQEDKNRTFTNWKTQLKKYTVEQLMAACSNYKKAKAGTEKQFLKSSANFLGKEKPFEDYLEAKPPDRAKSKYKEFKGDEYVT